MFHALVIEDQYLIAMMLGDELASHGFTSFDVASSPDQAISLASKRPPDLITVDDWLAEGSGLDAIRHICREKAIPVVFVTTDGDRVTVEAPDAVVIKKPFPPTALAPAIEAARQKARTWT